MNIFFQNNDLRNDNDTVLQKYCKCRRLHASSNETCDGKQLFYATLKRIFYVRRVNIYLVNAMLVLLLLNFQLRFAGLNELLSPNVHMRLTWRVMQLTLIKLKI